MFYFLMNGKNLQVQINNGIKIKGEGAYIMQKECMSAADAAIIAKYLHELLGKRAAQLWKEAYSRGYRHGEKGLKFKATADYYGLPLEF